MAEKSPPINVRLPSELADRFQALRGESPGLSSRLIVRALLAPKLSMPLDKQVEIVIAGLRKGKPAKSVSKNRVGLNAASSTQPE